jgi:hypothetical protein
MHVYVGGASLAPAIERSIGDPLCISVLSYLELSMRPMLLAFPYCVSNYFCTLHDAEDIVACIVRNTSRHMGNF